jgi:hypothetical protein
MSDPEHVAAIVCEGPTDIPILEEIIRARWPEVTQIKRLHPEVDELGKPKPGASMGWSEVKRWCESNAGSIDDVLTPLAGDAIDLLVIAMDVDIAIAAGIADPPKAVGAYETPRLCATVKGWLLPDKRKKLRKEIVIGLPAMAIEAWIIAALFPRQPRPEAIMSPAEYLASKKRLRWRKADGKPSKYLPAYIAFAEQVADRLHKVRKVCPEADRLCGKIERRRKETLGA